MAADAPPRQALTIDDLLGVDEESVKDAPPVESADEFPPLPGTSSSSQRDREVKNAMPTNIYKHIPNTGFLSMKFAKSLFPIATSSANERSGQIPNIELQTMEEALLAGNHPRTESTTEPTAAGVEPSLMVSGLPRNWADRRDLHCIVLDQFATNIQSDKRGFDRAMWMEPTRRAIADPAGTLELSRILRTTALDNSSSFFFRAATYTFVTPVVWANDVLGNVISITWRDQEPTKFRAAFEGASEAVVVTQSRDAVSQVAPQCFLRHEVFRTPASVEARKHLCRLVKSFLTCHPEEVILPLNVSQLGYQDLAWLHYLGNQFDRFCLNQGKDEPPSAADDGRTHWVRTVVPSLRAYPIRILLTLTDMPTEAGWTKGRPAEAWIDGAPSASHMQVHFVGVIPGGRELHITLMAQSGHIHLCCARLSRMEAYEDEEQEEVPKEDQISPTIRGRQTTLTTDQQKAAGFSCASYPVVALQAAFGTGKTVVGAVIAARQALTASNRVVVTASTNAVVAQFAETLLSIEEFSKLIILRYVSDTAVAEKRNPLPVDLNEVLKYLSDEFAANLSVSDKALCDRFREGRLRYEQFAQQENLDLCIRQKKGRVHARREGGFRNPRRRAWVDFSVLICEEASHVPERHEASQLEPHVRCSRTSNPAKFGARSVIDLLTAASLVTTFRVHPLLSGLPNTVAYNGTLMLQETRSGLQAGLTSMRPKQLNSCVASRSTPRRGQVELGTVDSVQGREKDVVILLTTRTDFNPETADFLDDPRRMNVALTRCRQGQFVLGNVESLRRVNFWSIVLSWAEARNAVVPASDLGQYLPSA
ncbi:hypothetical protein ANCDUO_08638 [Ancylostoma duodenale]|uniref:DNA2/NAM7 helicase-like C-terminal domain-containing protein n=1 Tax=Ancylostoma duodenale TaxID=51022 RepID=A0A0C2GPU8_9BILA|nr:hypothetical protein ANCDUO_08638 [Ancylostoma duodenale]